MGFKARRAKRSQTGSSAAEFRHSSGATDLDALLGDHTLTKEAEAAAPKGYRARSIAKNAKNAERSR